MAYLQVAYEWLWQVECVECAWCRSRDGSSDRRRWTGARGHGPAGGQEEWRCDANRAERSVCVDGGRAADAAYVACWNRQFESVHQSSKGTLDPRQQEGGERTRFDPSSHLRCNAFSFPSSIVLQPVAVFRLPFPPKRGRGQQLKSPHQHDNRRILCLRRPRAHIQSSKAKAALLVFLHVFHILQTRRFFPCPLLSISTTMHFQNQLHQASSARELTPS